MKILISMFLGFFYSILVFLFGDIDMNLKYLLSVVVLDFLTGLLKAHLKKKINSSISIKGIFKKISYFVIVSVSVIIGNILNLGEILRNLVIYSLVFSEIISILENCTEMGIKLPKILISSLEIFQKEMDDSENIFQENEKKRIKD